MTLRLIPRVVVLAFVCAGCGDGSTTVVDGGPDAGAVAPDGGGPNDAGPIDEDSGPTTDDGGPGDVDAGLVDVDAGLVDVDGGTAEIDAGGSLTPDSGAVDSGALDAGDLAPTCTITAPLDATVQDYDDDFVFVATASDPEDGTLSGASVVWSSSLVAASLGTGLSTTELLPPGVHTITCTATDSAGNTGTDTIIVTSRSPVAAIFHPGDGETRAASGAIPFVGQGRDFEDGMRTGAALVWTSSIDGMIGTGTSFSRTLSPGTNVVTLTVTDSSGNTGTDTVTLTITP